MELPDDPPYAVYLDKFPIGVSEADIRKFLINCNVRQVELPRNWCNSAYVELDDLDSLLRALDLNQQKWNNRCIRVSFARTRHEEYCESDQPSHVADYQETGSDSEWITVRRRRVSNIEDDKATEDIESEAPKSKESAHASNLVDFEAELNDSARTGTSDVLYIQDDNYCMEKTEDPESQDPRGKCKPKPFRPIGSTRPRTSTVMSVQDEESWARETKYVGPRTQDEYDEFERDFSDSDNEDNSISPTNVRSRYYKHFTSGLKRLKDQNQFCDIAIKVGNKTFNAHKAILASSCEYFRRMFTSGFIEATEGEIEMEGDAIVFESLLDLAYTGNMDHEFGREDRRITGVLEMACYLQFDRAIDMCKERIVAEFDAEMYRSSFFSLQSVFELIELAKKYEILSDLVLVCKEHIKKYFYFLTWHSYKDSTPECLQMCFGEIEENWGTGLTMEKDLLKFVIRWLQHNWDERKEFAPSLLKKLRLGLLTDSELKTAIDQMQDLKECKDILEEVLELKHTPRSELTGGTIQYLYPHYFAPRSTITTLVAIGGKTGLHRYLCTSEGKPYWKVLHQVPKLPIHTCYHSSITVKGKLYVAGGREVKFSKKDSGSSRGRSDGLYSHHNRQSQSLTENNFWQLNRIWQRLPPLIRSRYNFALLYFDGFLFCIGGRGKGGSVLREVDCYHEVTKVWQTIEPLPEAVLDPSAVVFEGRILVYGQSVKSDGTHIVQIFIPSNVASNYSQIKGVWEVALIETLSPSITKKIKPFITLQYGKCYRVTYVEVERHKNVDSVEASSKPSRSRNDANKEVYRVKVNQLQVEVKDKLSISLGSDERQHNEHQTELNPTITFDINNNVYVAHGGCVNKLYTQGNDHMDMEYYDAKGASVCLYTFDRLNGESIKYEASIHYDPSDYL